MRAIFSFSILALATFTWNIHGSDTIPAPSVPSKSVEPSVEVFGGVRSPGRYDWTNGMTVLDGISAAGGFTPLAAKHHIRVRHNDGNYEFFDKDMLEITNQPPRLQLRDEILVPVKQRIL